MKITIGFVKKKEKNGKVNKYNLMFFSGKYQKILKFFHVIF